MRPATRERVERAIRDLGYRVNASARSLRRGRTGVIGLALPELSLPYFAELADAIMAVAEERGVAVLIEHTGADPARELETLRASRRGMTDGLLFSPLGIGQEEVGALVVAAGLWHRASGADAINAAMDSGLEFDAVFGLNDTLALGVLHALHQRRVSVPEQVKVIGFDDIDEASYSTPTLTSVAPGRTPIAIYVRSSNVTIPRTPTQLLPDPQTPDLTRDVASTV